MNLGKAFAQLAMGILEAWTKYRLRTEQEKQVTAWIGRVSAGQEPIGTKTS
jgi:hypothetical protein